MRSLRAGQSARVMANAFRAPVPASSLAVVIINGKHHSNCWRALHLSPNPSLGGGKRCARANKIHARPHSHYVASTQPHVPCAKHPIHVTVPSLGLRITASLAQGFHTTMRPMRRTISAPLSLGPSHPTVGCMVCWRKDRMPPVQGAQARHLPTITTASAEVIKRREGAIIRSSSSRAVKNSSEQTLKTLSSGNKLYNQNDDT
ncbi:hypothetical protein ACFE04_019760 [Oxalis oulophora]